MKAIKDKANGDKSFTYGGKRVVSNKKPRTILSKKGYLRSRRVYGIFVNSKLVYIGSTINKLRVRLNCHLSEARKKCNRPHHPVLLNAMANGDKITAVEIYPSTVNWIHYEKFFIRMAKSNGINIFQEVL